MWRNHRSIWLLHAWFDARNHPEGHLHRNRVTTNLEIHILHCPTHHDRQKTSKTSTKDARDWILWDLKERNIKRGKMIGNSSTQLCNIKGESNEESQSAITDNRILLFSCRSGRIKTAAKHTQKRPRHKSINWYFSVVSSKLYRHVHLVEGQLKAS